LLKAPAEAIDRRMKLRHILTVKNMRHKKLPALELDLYQRDI
jgi:hypothetical protein